MTVTDFADFEAAFGADPGGGAARTDLGPEGRFRRFSREDVATLTDNLDLAWLRDDSEQHDDDLTEPDEIANAIVGHLRAALIEVEAVSVDLGMQALNDVEDAA